MGIFESWKLTIIARDWPLFFLAFFARIGHKQPTETLGYGFSAAGSLHHSPALYYCSRIVKTNLLRNVDKTFPSRNDFTKFAVANSKSIKYISAGR